MSLSAMRLMRLHRRLWNMGLPYRLTWGNPACGNTAPVVDFDIKIEGCAGAVGLSYPYGVRTVDRGIELVATRLPWGKDKLRWWFICPGKAKGKPCGRRVGQLYLPPGWRHFACRHCHGLTYKSCQESHKREATIEEVPWLACLSAKDLARRRKRELKVMRARGRWVIPAKGDGRWYS